MSDGLYSGPPGSSGPRKSQVNGEISMKLRASRAGTILIVIGILVLTRAWGQSGREGSPSAVLYLDRAKSGYASGNLEAALADCNMAIAFAPDWALLYAMRAQVRKDQRNLEGALADTTRLSSLPREWRIFTT